MRKPPPILSLLFLLYWGCKDVEFEDRVTLFTKTFGGSYIDIGNSIKQISDSGYIITGYT